MPDLKELDYQSRIRAQIAQDANLRLCSNCRPFTIIG
jgi:hypothetical protein